MASADCWRMREILNHGGGEDYVVDCCSKISEHEGSMYLASLHGSGMGPESIVDYD